MSENSKRNPLLVLLIFALFAAPALISWALLSFTSIGNEGGKSHGLLIDPPRVLANIQLVSLSSPEQPEQLHGKWSLLFLHEGSCAETCAENLYKMRQIRLATGKHAPRLQRVLVQLGDNISPLTAQQLKHFAGQLLLPAGQTGQFPGLDSFRLGETNSPIEEQRIYLVDPLGNLMLAYPVDAEPKGIIKDLNRLLRYSRIG